MYLGVSRDEQNNFERGTTNMKHEDMIKAIEAYREWKALEEAAKKEREALEAVIKEAMEHDGMEEASYGRYIVRYTSVLSNRFDSTAFKKEYPEVYLAYTKQVGSKRFTVSE